jgi:hypothetical protein
MASQDLPIGGGGPASGPGRGAAYPFILEVSTDETKTLILMVVAIGCGLVASYMTGRLLPERGVGAPADQPKVVVLVA